MQDHIECHIGSLKIRIDRLLCVGFGDCIEIAPEAFEFDAEGIVVFKEGLDQVERERLIKACAACPVDALVLWDEEGKQLAP